MTDISKDAFRGCSALVLTVQQGSYAEQYARDQNIPVSYPEQSPDWLTQ